MPTACARVPVAQYLRVSTDHQRYSLDNQSDFIERYATAQGFSIIQTYSDRAKSGLLLRNRAGLRQLLHDVMEGGAVYRAVLVYDISRWGRFQDVDEAGHYEFLCKHSGIPVHYCSETFANDGTAASIIMKALKRTMAAEYSRELGLKSFAGQKRIAELGFRAGGAAGYGLRRLLLSPDGRPKQQLRRGERKSLATDRVILVPGPDNEIACVRQIYQMLIVSGMTFVAIAADLNRRGVQCPNSISWTHHRVREILTNRKYNGAIVYGRTSKKLRTTELKVPSCQWIVTPHAFEPVIDDATFVAAKQALAGRTRNKSNDQLLEELRSILRAKGKLTAELIRGTKGATPAGGYRLRFGSLSRAYELVGYQMENSRNIETRCRIQQVQLSLMQELQDLFPKRVRIESRGGRYRKWLRLKGGTKIAVRVCLCFETASGQLRWRVKSDRRQNQSLVLISLMNTKNDAYRELYLFPALSLPSTASVSIDSSLFKMGHRIPNASLFLEVLSGIRQQRNDGARKIKLTRTLLRR